jgi:hypothetical protein
VILRIHCSLNGSVGSPDSVSVNCFCMMTDHGRLIALMRSLMFIESELAEEFTGLCLAQLTQTDDFLLEIPNGDAILSTQCSLNPITKILDYELPKSSKIHLKCINKTGNLNQFIFRHQHITYPCVRNT